MTAESSPFRSPKWYWMTPHVTPARPAMWVALAAANPSSLMQRTVSPMMASRVRSPRAWVRRTLRVGRLGVAADRAACAVAENQMASQIQKQGFPAKPHVTIEGFPFLTQVAAGRLNKVVIRAAG